MKESWLKEQREGSAQVQKFMRTCGKKYCCGGNHRFDDDEECKQEVKQRSTWKHLRKQVHRISIKHKTYPLAIVSRRLCMIIKDEIVSANVELLQKRELQSRAEQPFRRSARLHDMDAEGKGHGKVGGKGSNVSLASLSTPASRTPCIQPVDMRPDAWDCECHLRMKEKCKEVYKGSNFDENDEKDCFQAQMCNHGRVCDLWKDSNCPSSGPVKELQNLLHQPSGLLQKQEQSDVTEELMGLDESVQRKDCF